MRHEVRIKQAGPEDVPALYAMMKTLADLEGSGALVRTDEAVLARDGFGERPHFQAFLAEVNGEAVGYVSYTVNYAIWAGTRFLNVDDVFVTDRYRSAGVGRLLMQAIARECMANRLAYARWTVEVDNVDAIRFYRKLGATVREKGLCVWRFQ